MLKGFRRILLFRGSLTRVRIHGFQEDICMDHLDLGFDQTNKTLVWQLVYLDKSLFVFLIEVSNPLHCYRLEYMTEDGWMLFVALFPCTHQSS